jgi:hypothetical protein
VRCLNLKVTPRFETHRFHIDPATKLLTKHPTSMFQRWVFRIYGAEDLIVN